MVSELQSSHSPLNVVFGLKSKSLFTFIILISEFEGSFINLSLSKVCLIFQPILDCPDANHTSPNKTLFISSLSFSELIVIWCGIRSAFGVLILIFQYPSESVFVETFSPQLVSITTKFKGFEDPHTGTMLSCCKIILS